jgi:hypothetical protein
MNNNVVKIQIPISEFYQIINSANTLKAQQLTILGMVVKDRPSYDTMAESLKKVNDAIKDVEIARKNVTAPIDGFKKELIKLETDTLAELKEFIDSGKRKMLEYSQELERKKAEAEAKLKAEAEASLNNPMMAMAEALGTFTDKLFATSVSTDHTKNIRTTTKARINGEVDWIKVLMVQFSSNNLNAEDLIKGLPKAMKSLGVDAIEGIEIYEEKTQIIR